MQNDIVISLPSGTEISIEAALGDIGRAIADTADDGTKADLEHVAELVQHLAGLVPDVDFDSL